LCAVPHGTAHSLVLFFVLKMFFNVCSMWCYTAAKRNATQCTTPVWTHRYLYLEQHDVCAKTSALCDGSQRCTYRQPFPCCRQIL